MRDTILAAALALVLFATAPAYSRVLVDDTWRGRSLAAGLMALAVGWAVRRVGGGAFAALTSSVVGLVLFTYVTALPSVGLLPDASSLATFRDLLDAAAIGLRDEIAPVASTPAFTAAIATGAWLASYLAHELTVRFRRAGAGLVPFLVFWALPLTVPMDDPGSAVLRALPFLAAVGIVLLLSTPQGGEDDTPRATVSGLAVGAGALSVALIAPLLLPGYGGAAWVDLSGAESPRGYQPIVDVTERLQLPGERDVLRIRSSERLYLRLAGLDSFDGGTWRLGPSGAGSFQPAESSLYRADSPLPPEEPARATATARVEVEVLDLANIYVPTPYQPVTVRGQLAGEMVWSTEGGFLATWSVAEGEGLTGQPRVGVSEGATYAVDAERPVPSIDQLRAVELDGETRARWTALPRDYARLAEAAGAVYEAAGATTDVDRALALQDWFTDGGRFTYDLDVPALRGDQALERFVLEDRVGYCEYFATAMAVMLRATGIPARVAVGFLPGTVTDPADPDAGQPLTEYTVSTADAHAWVEVLFPGYGWITFEPTPRSDLTQIVPTEEDLAPVENLRERRLRELGELDTGEQQTPTPDTPDPVPAPDSATPTDPGTDQSGTEDGADDGGPWWPWVLALGLLALIGTVVLSRRDRAAGHTAPEARVLAAQRSLLATGRRYGVGRAPQETTAEVVRRWQAEGRVSAGGDRFAALAQAAAFGGDVDAAIAAEAEALVADLEAELRASVSPRDRALSPLRVPLETTAASARRAGAAVISRAPGRRG
ncbi:MAG: DUF3488 and transglutaminase-like domain-containing protein [Nitriliruptor sp.]|uniref:transglutaminase family protein n=1 Tax=Nitriliruptor sp. TaxID=2448056 RepID=UPI00349FEDEE